MGGINELSDELLIKILSYLPTKVAASTMILSKQWQFLWMWSPNLEFRYTHESESPNLAFRNTQESEFESLQCFLLRNLPIYRAPFIQRFSLHLFGLHIEPEDVKPWVQFAVSRDVCELDISYFSEYEDYDILPSSLYTCKSLVILKLGDVILLDVPRMVCLPSLKTLQLQNVMYGNEDSLSWLLSNCPVLEDLFLQWLSDGGKLIVRVPSLQRLSLGIDELDEFVIDTPSLEDLKLYCDQKPTYTSIKNMPKLKEACVDVKFSLFDKLIKWIPSVKRLTLCLSFDNISEVVFDDGFVFNKLRHLKLCICQPHLANVLVQVLKVAPNLRVLELITMSGHGGCYLEYWNKPSSVPECILSSLEIFKWWGYRGREEEKELVIYILQNALHLTTATFHLYKLNVDKNLEIKKELELASRASTTCHFPFY